MDKRAEDWNGLQFASIGRDGCQSALWDSFAAMLKMRPPKQSHNALWNYLDPFSH